MNLGFQTRIFEKSSFETSISEVFEIFLDTGVMIHFRGRLRSCIRIRVALMEKQLGTASIAEPVPKMQTFVTAQNVLPGPVSLEASE